MQPPDLLDPCSVGSTADFIADEKIKHAVQNGVRALVSAASRRAKELLQTAEEMHDVDTKQQMRALQQQHDKEVHALQQKLAILHSRQCLDAMAADVYREHMPDAECRASVEEQLDSGARVQGTFRQVLQHAVCCPLTPVKAIMQQAGCADASMSKAVITAYRDLSEVLHKLAWGHKGNVYLSEDPLFATSAEANALEVIAAVARGKGLTVKWV